MASFSDTNSASEAKTEADDSTDVKMDEADKLKCVQAANEGMKLLLNSRLKESEELFKRSR